MSAKTLVLRFSARPFICQCDRLPTDRELMHWLVCVCLYIVVISRWIFMNMNFFHMKNIVLCIYRRWHNLSTYNYFFFLKYVALNMNKLISWKAEKFRYRLNKCSSCRTIVEVSLTCTTVFELLKSLRSGWMWFHITQNIGGIFRWIFVLVNFFTKKDVVLRILALE